ncbi:hypothetical protein KP509_05G083000 [Ceratopteris richardii]|nr:hypothetical protein KP509_05G083000 [Ceratopteris richardii]
MSNDGASDVMFPKNEKQMIGPENASNDDLDGYGNGNFVDLSDGFNEMRIQDRNICKDDLRHSNPFQDYQGRHEYVFTHQEKTAIRSTTLINDGPGQNEKDLNLPYTEVNVGENNGLSLHVPDSKSGFSVGVVPYGKPHYEMSYPSMSLSASSLVDGLVDDITEKMEVTSSTVENNEIHVQPITNKLIESDNDIRHQQQ